LTFGSICSILSSMVPVAQMLKDMRRGTFAGRGGARALAQALNVHPQTIKAWRAGTLPTWEHRQAIRELWRAEGGEGP
jgi:hypothetical protein